MMTCQTLNIPAAELVELPEYPKSFHRGAWDHAAAVWVGGVGWL